MAIVQYQQPVGQTGWTVWNGVVYTPVLAYFEPKAGALSVAQDVVLPRDAIVDEARFVVSASAGRSTTIASVAAVRRTSEDGDPIAVIDFGRMVTVSSLSVSDIADSVWTWNGTTFIEVEDADPAQLGELATERIKLVLSSAVTEAAIGARGVFLPATPTGLELSVAGVTVWFERQGSDPGASGPLPAGDVVYDVERTDAVREAFRKAAAATSGPDVAVRVELRAATPGRLQLESRPRIRRVHPVTFPDGPSRTLDVAAEGPIALDLPLPEASAAWYVEAVELVARGTVPATRTLPATGPVAAVDAHLVLVPGRALLGRVPPQLSARFRTLTALRLLVDGGTAGGEIGGVLLGDVAGAPGEPIPGGELRPASVRGGGGAGWVTLELTEPLEPPGPLWLEVQAASGSIAWGLTPSPATDPRAPGATLRRRLPGGGVRPLSQVAALSERLGALRVVGVPDPNQPIEALSVAVDDDPNPAPFTPTSDGVRVQLGRAEALTPEGGLLHLTGEAAASGSYTFEGLSVIYQETAP